MTNEETKAKTKADAAATAEIAKINAAHVAEAKKARAEELSKLTFTERVEELRKENFMVGLADGTGLSDSTSARRIPTGAVLAVIHDKVNYSINLDLQDEAGFVSMAEHVGEVLGVKFDTKDLETTDSQLRAIKAAQVAAKEAKGHFVLDK